MFNIICFNAALSSALVTAVATASAKLGGDEPLVEDNDVGPMATAGNLFVPHKLRGIDSFADIDNDGILQSLRPFEELEAGNPQVKTLRNALRDSYMSKENTAVFDPSKELGILAKGGLAPDQAPVIRELNKDNLDYVCDYRLKIYFDGSDFRGFLDYYLSSIYIECYGYTENLVCWDTSRVTNMNGAFEGQYDFNYDLSLWDVSSVTTMKGMFYNTPNFNQPLGNWDVSSVTKMSDMFSESSFNQPLDNWDVSSVITMRSMFNEADFNQPIDNWDVSSVTNMNDMFRLNFDFNQPLDNWDVSSVRGMKRMFLGSYFDHPLGNWDVSSVIDMKQMFDLTDFNQPIDNWDVSGVINMKYMFGFSNFNQPLNNWDVSNVANMIGMFFITFDFNQPLDNWNVSSVRSMRDMFRDAFVFNQPLDNWDVSGVTRMNRMFQTAYDFNQCFSTWAFKVQDDVDLTKIFKESGCPVEGRPQPDVSPWCQSVIDGCPAGNPT